MRQDEDVQWGAAAVASSGGLTIEVDEAAGGSEAYQVAFDSPAFYLSIRIDHPLQLAELLAFIKHARNGGGGGAEHEMGLATGPRLRLVCDDEIAGRYFLTTAGRGYALRVTLAQQQMDEVVAALTDVALQLGI